MGVGNVSLYVFSLLSSVVFLVLGAAATTQAVRHSRTVGGTLRAAALAAVASFAWLRVINNGAHVVRAYVGMADVMKHLLFVVPLAFAFSAFSVIIFLWFRRNCWASRTTLAPSIISIGLGQRCRYLMLKV